jgi:hypothetical protein
MTYSPPNDDRRTPTVAEDGEMMGTLRQFATLLQLPSSLLLRCIETQERAIVLRQEEGGQPVLILGADSLADVCECVVDGGNGSVPAPAGG